MTSSFNTIPAVNFSTLVFAGSNTNPPSFSPERTYSTADMLLRIAARRQYVRAIQALRRR